MHISEPVAQEHILEAQHRPYNLIGVIQAGDPTRQLGAQSIRIPSFAHGFRSTMNTSIAGAKSSSSGRGAER
ncbi:MAG TPA: hypothetical protein PKE21_02035 [Flavobacteriales bacterium]|nr:hypothetical protein [Flavobacteriales bacterium]HMR26234.1 hypothetical protein [Flavobacteriales bacterium]